MQAPRPSAKKQTAAGKEIFISALLCNAPDRSGLTFRVRALLIMSQHTKIHDVKRVAVAVEPHRNGSLEAVEMDLRPGPFFRSAVHGEVLDRAGVDVHANHLAADRAQNLSRRRRFVTEDRDKRFAHIT